MKGVINMTYKNGMKHFSDMNAKVYNLDNLTMPGAYYLQEGFVINIMRKGCNKYGNPVYHLYMEDKYMTKIKNTKGRFGKVLTDKYGLKYLTFTSYNFSSDLKHLFKICGIC